MENDLQKVDVLAIGVHPDDVELGCAGTLLKSVDQGRAIGICDLTRGELGTRGSAELRLVEAEQARKILGASFRVNLEMEDGFFEVNEENKRKIIEIIRASQPDVVLCNALSDRHPDHGRSAQLAKEACFLSGLAKVVTQHNGVSQKAWRPRVVLHYIQDNLAIPHFVVDVSGYWEQKMKAIMAFSSQFYNPESSEPMTSIASQDFLNMIQGRGYNYGRYMMASYGEGFMCERPLGIHDITSLV